MGKFLFKLCLFAVPALVIATGLPVSPDAHAGPKRSIVKASELHKACLPGAHAEDPTKYVRRSVRTPECTRFLNGLLHTLQLAQKGYSATQTNSSYLTLKECIHFPNGASSISELQNIIVNYGDRHAELMDLPAFDFATAALAAWYPCSKNAADDIPMRFRR